jgi:hypothetical protein
LAGPAGLEAALAAGVLADFGSDTLTSGFPFPLPALFPVSFFIADFNWPLSLEFFFWVSMF